MLHFNIISAFMAIYCLSVTQTAGVKPQNYHYNQVRAGQKPWDLLEAIRAPWNIRGFKGIWITDNEFYYISNNLSIFKYNAFSNRYSIIVDSDFLSMYYLIGSLQFSPDNTKILLRYDVEKNFRQSYIAKYDVFDIATHEVIQIHGGEKLQHCVWSPVKDRLAYVYNNNVFIHFGESFEVQITSDGIDGVFYNGIPDWVYGKNLLPSSGSAMWWSDNGNYLAVGVFNDADVQTFKYFLSGEADDPLYQYPKEVDLKYPKSGTSNPVVALRVFHLLFSQPTYITIKAPVEKVSKDHILQSVVWTSDRKLMITWLNRRQNVASLQLCTVWGDCEEVQNIAEPSGWVSIGDPICLKNSQNCLFTYWIDNWYQVWNLDLALRKNVWSSLGEFTVLNVYGYDETNEKLYYRATLASNISVYQLFSNNDCLTCNLKDEDGQDCLSASASFSKNFSYYAVTCSGPNPSYTKIFETKTNKEVTNWEANTAFRAKLSTKLRPDIKYMNVTLKDGTIGIAKLQYPPNMDTNKTYPMIVDVYGGPNSVTVTRSFGVGFETYMITNREVIYVVIDGRGTGNKGKNILFSVNNHLGEYEVEDQIYVTKYLQNILPFVDRKRCGIWGWSYGGYMTARTLASDNDRVFKCGISVAPITSWLHYHTIYTERYMGLPKENMVKYAETSVFENVSNFRKHDFMLIHGSADENVHYQHSLLLAKVLQKNNILFKQMTYTDESHDIRNLSPHLYNTMDNFWTDCLNLDAKNEK